MPASIVDQLGTLSQIGTIVHLGAGSGLDVPKLRATGAKKIVLVEPNPALLPALRKAASDPRCVVLPLAVAEAEGQAQLHQFSFPALSSLKPATQALKELFPGLEETALPSVETLPLDAILTRAEVVRSKHDVLIIDTPGMEASVVAMVNAMPEADRFAHVLLRTGNSVLYEGSKGYTALRKLLEGEGYRHESRLTADPDFPEARFSLDPVAFELRRLSGEADALNRSLREQSEALNTLRAENAALQAQLSRESARREKMELEFLRAEAQMSLLREFLEIGAPRARTAPAAKQTTSPAPRQRKAKAS